MLKRLAIIAVMTATVTTLCVVVAWFLKPPTEADADEVFWAAQEVLDKAVTHWDAERAAKKFRVARDMYEKLQAPWGEARALSRLADIYTGMEQYAKAVEYSERSLQLRRENGDARGEAACLYFLGYLHKSLNQDSRAEQYWQESSKAFERNGVAEGEGYSLIGIANIHLDKNQHAQAAEYLERALVLVRKAGNLKLEGEILQNLAYSYHQIGKDISARECQDQYQEIARKLGLTPQ